jgi:hypothetical protein
LILICAKLKLDLLPSSSKSNLFVEAHKVIIKVIGY